MGDHLHSSNSCVSDNGWRVIDQQFVEIPIVVPDGWSSVMSIGDYLPCVMSPILVIVAMLQSGMLARVARWGCQRVQEILRGFIGPDLHRSSYFIIRIHSAQLGFGSLHSNDFRNFELLWVIF
jgi:hypothetical protein